jgi:hypothetical protein
VLVEDLFDFTKIVPGRDQNATLAHHRFSEEGGDVAGGGEAYDLVN